MPGKLYERWMYAWETALTTRDENRVVRPLEWGFEWLDDFVDGAGLRAVVERAEQGDERAAEQAMIAVNEAIAANSAAFFAYRRPEDFRLEERAPQLFPTNVRPETQRRDAHLKRSMAQGKLKAAQFLRFTSPVRTPYPHNDLVNARWFPAEDRAPGTGHRAQESGRKPKRAMIVMPQWNADAFSHNALCSLFNRFGISALRLSKPFHDIRRPAEIERSDYACSANIGRTIAAARQAIVDVRCCLDWLESQGYEEFGILGTSLGSCYAFIASAHDARIRVNAFNHASMAFGDVVWTGQSTRHIRTGFEDAGLTQEQLYWLWSGISPVSYMERFAGQDKKVLVVYARYDLTFLPEYSERVVASFARLGVDYTAKVLPCGHYTTGEFPYKFIDGWYLGKFIYTAFRDLKPSQRGAAGSGAESEKAEMVER